MPETAQTTDKTTDQTTENKNGSNNSTAASHSPEHSKKLSPIQQLIKLTNSYLGKSDIAEIQKAFEFGAKAHEGQTRKTGEAYINHPVSVAVILAEMHMDTDTLVAAILHDVIEDTSISQQEISQLFNPTVALLVDSVSKLDHLDFENKEAAKTASLQKMILAMVGDIRVILIKLADRLHNMRTLGVMRLDKQRRIAHETLDIYAPIATRLGINTIRKELQDLGLKALYPMRYRILADAKRKSRGNRKEAMNKVEIMLASKLEESGIDGEVVAREKTLYSTYRKMRTKKHSFQDIHDLFAVRITTQSVDDCYRILGLVHNLYRPVPGLFKDYIAIPKTNGYQGLHTVLFGPHGLEVEVQIRTESMDQFAESGIAAHWRYKTGAGTNADAQSRLRDWLQGLLLIQQDAGNSEEFLENVKIDLFPDQIYVFTPKGAVIELPKGATPIDFAYAIHTDIGNSCMSVNINKKMSPLNAELENGQTVKITTSEHAKPNAYWLSWVVTGRARTAIRNFLKNLSDSDAEKLGERLLTQALLAYKIGIEDIPENSMKMITQEYGYSSVNELFIAIGLGVRMPKLVARRIAPSQANSKTTTQADKNIQIVGTEGLAISYAKCCHPVPGDKIVGLALPGSGIVIHQQRCKNIKNTFNEADMWVDLVWSNALDVTFSAAIRITTHTDRGVLAQVATIIAEQGCNIEHVTHTPGDNDGSNMNFIISVKDRKHLANVMRKLRNRKFVLKVSRIRS